MRKYQFSETAKSSKSKSGANTQYVKELKALLRKQKRWMSRIRRAMTALAKIDRQIKRLDK